MLRDSVTGDTGFSFEEEETMDTTTFIRQFVRCMLVFSIAVTLSFAAVPMVSGRSFRIAKLPDKGKNFGCATCHVNGNGGGKRNAFGRDYEKLGIKAGDKYTRRLGKLDSDGDGFTNRKEFAAGTNPGDPLSRPAPRK